MNATWLQMTNGIALAATATNPPDQGALSLLQQMVQLMARLGTTYDTATTTTTAVLNPAGQFFPEQFDAIQAALKQNSGLTAAQLGA